MVTMQMMVASSVPQPLVRVMGLPSPLEMWWAVDSTSYHALSFLPRMASTWALPLQIFL